MEVKKWMWKSCDIPSMYYKLCLRTTKVWLQKVRQVYRKLWMAWTQLHKNMVWKINIKKTTVMKVYKVGGEVNITINGTKIEQVKSFKYLGHTMTDDGRCEKR